MRFLIFGDVVGEPGRRGITKALPKLRQQHQPDAVIVNIENITHGHGISENAIKAIEPWKASVYTSGDHAWDNSEGVALMEDKKIPLIRPANYPPNVPGRGYHIFTLGAYRIAVLNLQGQVFFRNQPLNPFIYLDELLKKPDIQEANIIMLDFHADATSEMRGLGWYADGRVSAVWGTHSHVPTADWQILPAGTGYITDIGMNGAYHSIIGMAPAGPLKTFLTQVKQSYEPPENGPLELNAILLDIDPKTKKTTSIANIRQIIANEGD